MWSSLDFSCRNPNMNNTNNAKLQTLATDNVNISFQDTHRTT
jgi:hypothetical protein